MGRACAASRARPAMETHERRRTAAEPARIAETGATTKRRRPPPSLAAAPWSPQAAAWWLDQRGDTRIADRGDLLGSAVELGVRQHRGALEGQVAGDLQPRPTATELVLDPHGDRPRNAVGAQEDDVQRVATLPRQALLGVVGRPPVIGGQLTDGSWVGDRPAGSHLGPCADAHAVGLADPAVTRQRVERRLTIRPYALFEGATELRL